MSRLRALHRNPFFRSELRRRVLRTAVWALPGASLVYVAAFAVVRVSRDLVVLNSGHLLRADFNYGPWLSAAGALLSLWAHWLVPPFLLIVLCRNYELETLQLIVAGRYREEEVVGGQVAAALTPPALGAAPMLLLIPLFAVYAPTYLPVLLAAGGLAVLWAGLTSGATCWSGVSHAPLPRAAAWTYGLTCAALPAGIGGVALLVGHGCSAGRTNQEFVFQLAAGLTAGILITGTAAAFWDATIARLFPERRQPLWMDAPPPPRPEG